MSKYQRSKYGFNSIHKSTNLSTEYFDATRERFDFHDIAKQEGGNQKLLDLGVMDMSQFGDGSFTTANLAIGVIGVIRPKVIKNPSILEYQTKHGHYDTFHACSNWQRAIYNLFVQYNKQTNKINYEFARQLHTAISTGSGLPREQCWQKWDDWHKKISTNEVPDSMNNPDADKMLVSFSGIKQMLFQWMQNIREANGSRPNIGD